MKKIANKEFGDIFISDYIIDELATGLLKKTGIINTVRICNELLDSVHLLNMDNTSFNKSYDLFKKQRNTLLSFTDCTNIILMEEKGIRNLATFDNDFKHVPKINVIND